MKQNENPAALLVIFGATGDLANRKLFPSLYNLFTKGKLSKNFAIIGVARRSLSNDQFKNNVKKSIQTISDDQEKMNEFASHFYYHSHDVTDSDSYTALKESPQIWMNNIRQVEIEFFIWPWHLNFLERSPLI